MWIIRGRATTANNFATDCVVVLITWVGWWIISSLIIINNSARVKLGRTSSQVQWDVQIRPRWLRGVCSVLGYEKVYTFNMLSTWHRHDRWRELIIAVRHFSCTQESQIQHPVILKKMIWDEHNNRSSLFGFQILHNLPVVIHIEVFDDAAPTLLSRLLLSIRNDQNEALSFQLGFVLL